MGKRYFCDYCERSFADGAENRKKHLASIHHQKLRKAHYDTFKDAATILEENKMKKPCRKFLMTGACEFGMSCKYNHLTPSDIQELEKQAAIEKLGPLHSVKPNIEPEVDSWIESKISKIREHNPPNLSTANSILPPMLANIPNLPPSLIPSTLFQFYDAQKKNIQEWA